jgi:hypothetical protein
MSEILRTPLSDPSVWRGSDLQDSCLWTKDLTAADINLLESALASRRDTTSSMARRTWRELLSNTHLGALLDSLADNLQYGRGFVLLRGLPVERYAPDDLTDMYLGIGSYLGAVIPQNIAGEMIGHVTNAGEKTQTAQRGYMTRAALAPHSDVGDVVGLLCVRKAREGGTSIIASSMMIYNHILANRPEYLETLYQGCIEHWLDSSSGVSQRRNPIYEYKKGRLGCSFHPSAIRNGHAKAGIALTPIEREVTQYIQTVAMQPDVRLEMDLEPGDIQFLNNRLVLHSRSAFDDYDEPERGRLLLRMWLNLPDRPEPDASPQTLHANLINECARGENDTR